MFVANHRILDKGKMYYFDLMLQDIDLELYIIAEFF